MSLGCSRCEFGWVLVTPAYADRIVPGAAEARATLDALKPDTPEYAEAYVAWKVLQARRDGALNTWYPCVDCNASSFHRWRLGCMEPDHRPCENCR